METGEKMEEKKGLAAGRIKLNSLLDFRQVESLQGSSTPFHGLFVAMSGDGTPRKNKEDDIVHGQEAFSKREHEWSPAISRKRVLNEQRKPSNGLKWRSVRR